MFIFGVIFALIAGVLFGLIGPTTKLAYNADAAVALVIFMRYAIASIIILPLVPYQKSLLSNYGENLKLFIFICSPRFEKLSKLKPPRMLIKVSSFKMFNSLIFIFSFSIFEERESLSKLSRLESNLVKIIWKKLDMSFDDDEFRFKSNFESEKSI